MSALNIAIVEDESSHAEVLQQYIRGWEKKNHKECRFYQFSDAESFLFEWAENKDWDVLFLDIQMPGMNGVELAKKIRDQGDQVAVVFTTGITDYLREGYEVAALHYLVKPLDPGKVETCMQRVMRERSEREKEQVFLIEAEEIRNGEPGERTMLRLLQRDIVYIEAVAHNSDVHLEKSVYRDREGIGVWKDRLRAGSFVVCHRSYLVNLLYIRRIDPAEIILDSGERLPLSRRNVKGVKDAFIRFYSKGDEGLR